MRLPFTLFFFYCTLMVQAQTADEVIRNYIDFTGGEKKWQKITSIVSTGEYDYGGVAFPFTSYAKAPNRYKFVVTFNGKYYAQGFDGKSGWKIDAFKGETTPTLLEGKPAMAMANEANVELENALMGYKRKGHTVTLEGKETLAGKPYYKIKLLRQAGDAETYYFDTQDFSLFMKTSVAKNVELEGALLNTYFSDYRNVAGLTIPFLVISKANEQTILTINVKRVTLNVDINEAEFKPVK